MPMNTFVRVNLIKVHTQTHWQPTSMPFVCILRVDVCLDDATPASCMERGIFNQIGGLARYNSSNSRDEWNFLDV